MSFRRYPEYRDSGVPWLGAMPAHWTVNRLKRACEVYPSNVDKKSYEGETYVLLCNYTDVYYNERIVAGMDFMAATASDDQIEKFTLRAGDTILTKDSETADDIAIAAYVVGPAKFNFQRTPLTRPSARRGVAFREISKFGLGGSRISLHSGPLRRVHASCVNHFRSVGIVLCRN